MTPTTAASKDPTTRVSRVLAIAAGVLLAIAAAILLAKTLAHHGVGSVSYFGTPVEPPRTANDAVLSGAGGQPVHLLDAAYPATFLFFGYTHCPDECPLALASLAKAYRGLSPAAQARTRIVFVSVDPARDTPAVMTRYVTHFGARISGLTGSEAQLAPVWRDYGVEIDSKTREIGHGDAIYAIDSTQRVILIYTPDTPPSELLADAKQLAGMK
jgi:protein SCO1/2